MNPLRLLIKLCTVILLLSAGFLADGQSLQVIRFSEDEGLANTLVKSVATDQNGRIWVATDGGLFLFNGHEFSRYSGDLPSPYVKSVFCRRNGDMVITTDLGVLISGNQAGKGVQKQLLKGSVVLVDSLLWFPKACFEDKKERLWFGDNRKIYCLSGSRLRSYLPGGKAVTNNFQRSFSFAEDQYGHLFSFAEPGFVFLYDPEGDRFTEVRLPRRLSNVESVLAVDGRTFLLATKTGLVEFHSGASGGCERITPVQGSPEISSLYCYAPGRFYAGTWANGLYEIRRNGAGYTVRQLEDIKEKNINHIAGGVDGKAWIASDNGLYLLRQNLFCNPFKELATDYIQCISALGRGTMCFSDGQKIYQARVGDDPCPACAVDVLKRSPVTILQALPWDGGIWFSDVGAKIWYEKPVGNIVRQFDFTSQGRAVFYLMRDRNGNIWACQDQNPKLICITPEYTVRTYGAGKGITSRPLVTTMDAGGRVFAGGMSDSAFLFKYDPVKDRFVNLTEPVRFEHNIDVNINDMAFDRKGVLWLASSFGLLKFENNALSRVDLGQMTGSSVKALAVDANDNLWLGNSVGLHIYTDNQVLTFDQRSGISSKIINYRCLDVDSANRLWVGSIDGIRVSAPLTPPRKTITPGIFAILVNDKDEVGFLPEGTHFNNHSFASLKVGVSDYPADDFKLEMKLIGRDSAWQPVPRSGSLILANLKPGEYALLLRAVKQGNYLPSDILQWRFGVTRIWYTREWVVALMVVAVMLLFWLGLYANTLKLKRNNEKLEQMVRERTRETIVQKERIEAQHVDILEKNEELRKANIDFHKAKVVAEEATEAQKKLLSVMTHELRTPLNAVIGAAHLLSRNHPRPDQFEDLHILRFSAENLLRLINNILDFAKIESGKVELEKVEFNLRHLMEEIVSAMNIRAKEKAIRLRLHVDEMVPALLIGDPLRLSQIINNLISNAIKFTDHGAIDLELLFVSRVGNEVEISFMVCDTGIGMSAESMEKIFNTFVQGSDDTSRKYGGTGLGLVITRKLVELYGSEIRVKSEPGKGSCFNFILRLTECQFSDSRIDQREEDHEMTPFSGQRILLVEDNDMNKLIATKFLEDWNLTVETADNGLEAIEKVTAKNFDLVLMDIQMPQMEGYQASAHIRAMGTEPYTSIPIIALTAAIRMDISTMVTQSGMNNFIAKPFNPVDLHMKLKTYLG